MISSSYYIIRYATKLVTRNARGRTLLLLQKQLMPISITATNMENAHLRVLIVRSGMRLLANARLFHVITRYFKPPLLVLKRLNAE
jgi:hypothetical protein